MINRITRNAKDRRDENLPIDHTLSVERLQRRDYVAASLVAVIAGLILATGLLWGIPSSKTVVGALQVLDGARPYRDFWSMYAPGMFYAVAGLYWLFGSEILVQGVATVLVNSLAASVFYLLLRRVGSSRSLALPLSALFIAAQWQTALEFTSYIPARLLLLLGWLCMIGYFDSGRVRKLYFAGLLFGFAAWFKHDVAAYATAGSAIALLIAWYVSGARRRPEWLRPAPAIAALAASALLMVAPVVGMLAWTVGGDAWEDLIVFPGTVFQVVRAESYPPLVPPISPIVAWTQDLGNLSNGSRAGQLLSSWILGNVPQIIFVAAAGALTFCHRRMSPTIIARTGLFLACLLPYWLAAHIQQNTHFFSMSMLSLLLLAMAWQRRNYVRIRRRLFAGVLVATPVVLGVGMVIWPAMSAFKMLHEWPTSHVLDFPGVRGVRVSESDYRVFEPIARFVRERIPEDELIYVGVKRHDAIVISNLRFFVLTGRRSACRYAELHPGVTDRATVQREIRDTIERESVRCVILWKFGFSKKRLDQYRDTYVSATPDGGATLLDDYLRLEFETVGVYGEYHLMWRRGEPIPDAEDEPQAVAPNAPPA